VLAYLEVVYVGCFLLVPAGLVLLTATGRSALADRYWTIVTSAEFGSFAPLAFVQTRPPWKLERPAALRDRAIHRAAARFVRRFTIGVNTFPSGHAAGSVAVALGVIDALPIAGIVLLALALTISVAAVVGRYHYTIDVIAGVLLAMAIWMAVISFGFPNV
jgi:membrane-associated phospholipid phosphatase